MDALVRAIMNNPAALRKLANAVRDALLKTARRLGNSGSQRGGLFGSWPGGQGQ